MRIMLFAYCTSGRAPGQSSAGGPTFSGEQTRFSLEIFYLRIMIRRRSPGRSAAVANARTLHIARSPESGCAVGFDVPQPVTRSETERPRRPVPPGGLARPLDPVPLPPAATTRQGRDRP